MKKALFGLLSLSLLVTSCVPQKKYAELEAQNRDVQSLLDAATVKLNSCMEDTARLKLLEDQNAYLKANNQ